MAKMKWATARKPEPYYLPTPSFGLNRALGGVGLSSGRIHIYWGPKASGKTTIALQQIAQAQKEGKVCAFMDSERALDMQWAIRNGVDVDALRYTDTLIVEEGLELLMPSLSSGEIDILVVDSVNSFNYRSYFEKPEGNPIGSYSRSAKFFTHKLLSCLGPQQQVIFISQASMQDKGNFFKLDAAVGNAIGHWASTMVHFSKMNAKADVRDDGSFKVKWKLEKSKQSVYPVDGHYYFNPRTAEIDTMTEVITYGVEDGILNLGGAGWFTLDGGEKIQGPVQLAAYYKENPEEYELLKKRLNEIEVVAMEEELPEE